MNDVTPQRALELYLEQKRKTAAKSTVRSHKNRLSHFVTWFESETEYEYLNELDGLDIREWRIWRFDEDHSDSYIKAVQDAVRVYLRFCCDIEAVPSNLPEKVRSPDGGAQRSNEIKASRATEILEYLDRYRYASIEHTLFHLLWYALLRVGGSRAIDLSDIDWSENQIKLRHRPQQDTPLKSGYSSERRIAIRPATHEILNDYIEQNRPEVTDQYGRKPLFITPQGSGRPHQNSLRNIIYATTRPCVIRECPHERDIKECEATDRKNWAHKCPSSESTHAIRRGSISWHLRRETTKQVVSDRADVHPETLDKHYSTLSEGEKAEVRRGELPTELD
jgi:site-specific recombinase XerD